MFPKASSIPQKKDKTIILDNPTRISSTRILFNQGKSRIPVQNLEVKFYSSIGFIETTCNQDINKKVFTFIGTGALIRLNLILTCLHNFEIFPYHKADCDKINCMYFTPSASCTDSEYTRYKIIRVEKIGNQDLAVGFLEAQVPPEYGIIKYRALEDDKLKNTYIIVAGYPGEDQKENIRLLKEKDGKIYKVEEKTIHYKLTTSPGQSGSPIIKITKRNRFYIVGVHTKGNNFLREGERITKENIILIDKICQDHGIKINYFDHFIELSAKKDIFHEELLQSGFKCIRFLFKSDLNGQIEASNKLDYILDKIQKKLDEFNKLNKSNIKNIWITKYFDFCNILVKTNFMIDYNSKKALSWDSNFDSLDWRILKKIIRLKNIFSNELIQKLTGKDPELEMNIDHNTENNLNLSDKYKNIWKSFQKMVETSLDHLRWKPNSKIHTYTKKILKYLKNFIEESVTNEKIIKRLSNFIIEGKIPKNFSRLNHDIIIGDDGGAYLFFDKMVPAEKNEILEIFKEKGIEIGERLDEDNLELGKGSFGLYVKKFRVEAKSLNLKVIS